MARRTSTLMLPVDMSMTVRECFLAAACPYVGCVVVGDAAFLPSNIRPFRK